MANTQAMNINPMIASIAGDYALRLIKGGEVRFATYCELPTGGLRSYYTTPEQVAASVGKTPEIFEPAPKR